MFSLVLTPYEVSVSEIVFSNWPKHPEAWTPEFETNQEKLYRSVAARNGFPEHRMKWFMDPDFFVGGRGKSRKEVFERNGTSGLEIVRHPNFHSRLHYFIYGPELPTEFMRDYSIFVADLMKPLSSGDIEPLRKEARRLIRAYRLDRGCADEVFKLALELDLNSWQAESVYRAASAVR